MTKSQAYQSKRPLPFDITPKQKALIKITPDDYSLLANDERQDAQDIAAAILDEWSAECDRRGFDVEFGVYVPVRYGFALADEAKTRKSIRTQKEKQAKILEIFSEIATDLDMSIEEVQEFVANAENSKDLRIIKYTNKLIALNSDDSELESNIDLVSAIMQRTFKDWNNNDTELLPPGILESVFSFISQENNRAFEKSGSTDEKK